MKGPKKTKSRLGKHPPQLLLLFPISKEIAYLTEKQLPDIRLSSIGFVFQDFSLLPSLTALENVEFVIDQAGGPKNRARPLLEERGFAKRLNFLPHQLSGSEKQRVAIGRSLANQPALVLADEPTANLDSQSGSQVIEHLCRLIKQENRGAIIVSHDQRIIPFVDTTLWLEDGRPYRVKRVKTLLLVSS